MKERIFSADMVRFISTYLPPYTSDLSAKADVYMVGSDQVWNLAIVQRQMNNYMLGFVPQGGKKVAYAASFGTEQWTASEYTEEATRLLKEFQYVTVREHSGVELAETEFGVKAHHVLDPCLLLKDYSEIIGVKTAAEPLSDNLVVYKLNYTYDWYLNVKLTAEKLGCNLVELCGRRLKDKGDMHGFNVKGVSVRNWITAIANAKYVITDSFHGCVFSVIFGKPFVIVPGLKNRSTRLTSLLSDLGLSDRIVKKYDDCEKVLHKQIDYHTVNRKLDVLRAKSYSHLASMLQD